MTEPVANPATSAATRRPFYAALLLFSAPLLLAFAVYYGSGWRPQGTTNKGELITPVIPLPLLNLTQADGSVVPTALRQTWVLLQVSEHCDAECNAALQRMQTARQLLGKDSTRISVALLLTPCCEVQGLPANASIQLLRGDDAAGQQLRALLSPLVSATNPQQYLYIVDPLGNVMMRYAAQVDPRDIYPHFFYAETPSGRKTSSAIFTTLSLCDGKFGSARL